ncbi:MAG: discoidin domain-containing protein [Magnetococcales bacterium]|nr:discoidin domain-containing protein [Magnetococcales bacterium]MBF0114773.1 discoidin domain-containing protein [Magnetococcales bacterium]
MSGYRYWRLQVDATTSGSDHLLSCYELELRATVGGGDQCQGGVASASHNSSTAYRLFDDNTSSYWSNGGPGSSSWIQYDFGSGAAVVVGELKILPRSSWMSPEDFSLSGSEDGSNWQTIATWNGISAWTAGVERLFVPPAPAAVLQHRQCALPYAVALGRLGRHSYDLGLWSSLQQAHPFALVVARGEEHAWWLLQHDPEPCRALAQTWGMRLQQRCLQHFAAWLEQAMEARWTRYVGAHISQVIHASVAQGRSLPYALHTPVQRAHGQRMAATWSGTHAQRQCYALQEKEKLWCCRSWSWRLLSAPVPLIRQPPALAITFSQRSTRAQPLSLQAAQVSYQAEQGVWRAQLHLAQAADFVALVLDEPFVLHLNDEAFHLLVDGKRLQHSHKKGEERILFGVSPLAAYSAPRAGRLNQTWSQPTSARQLLATLLPLPMEWQLPDWPLPPGLLRAQAESPLQVAQRLVESVGGVIQSRADGSLLIRALIPEAPQQWPKRPVAHLLTDDADLLAIELLQRVGKQVDRVVVRNGSPDSSSRPDPLLSIGPDARMERDSPGQQSYLPGETAHVLVNPAAAVPFLQLHSSTGLTLQASEPVLWQESEDLLFTASNLARLESVAERIEAHLWLGDALGAPRLLDDGRTVWVERCGTAVLRLTVSRLARSFPLPIPEQLAQEEPYPVLVTASSAPNWGVGPLVVTLERERVCYPEQEVYAPLLTNANALHSRARMELAQGSGLQELQLTILLRTVLAAGQLIEVQDGGFAAPFRAMITEVSHELEPQGWLTRLKVWR